MIVRMWEVRARAAQLHRPADLGIDVALPAIEVNPLHMCSEVYSSPDFRLVVITKWRSHPESFREPPAHLITRPPHSWDFSPVDRVTGSVPRYVPCSSRARDAGVGKRRAHRGGVSG